jgi:hypothetical protein
MDLLHGSRCILIQDFPVSFFWIFLYLSFRIFLSLSVYLPWISHTDLTVSPMDLPVSLVQDFFVTSHPGFSSISLYLQWISLDSQPKISPMDFLSLFVCVSSMDLPAFLIPDLAVYPQDFPVSLIQNFPVFLMDLSVSLIQDFPLSLMHLVWITVHFPWISHSGSPCISPDLYVTPLGLFVSSYFFHISVSVFFIQNLPGSPRVSLLDLESVAQINLQFLSVCNCFRIFFLWVLFFTGSATNKVHSKIKKPPPVALGW